MPCKSFTKSILQSIPPADIYRLRLEETPLSDELSDFARQIIFGVLPLTHTLDQFIAKYAPEWPLDQIAAIDRNILRMALWEFAVYHDTPIKVAINEAGGTGEAVRF